MRIVLFNLVPYAEIRQVKRIRAVSISYVVALMIMAGFLWEVEQAVAQMLSNQKAAVAEVVRQQARVEQKANQIATYQAELQELRAQASVLLQLQDFASSRSQLFSVLSRTKPGDIDVTSVSLDLYSLQVEGKVRNLPALSQWVETLSKQDSLIFESEIKLVREVDSPNGQVLHEFKLFTSHRLPVDSGGLQQLENQLRAKGIL